VSKKLTPEEKELRASCHARVSPEQLQAIDAMAKRERRSRSSMAALLLEWALQEKAGQSAVNCLKMETWNK
jgi:hypothetical protein